MKKLIALIGAVATAFGLYAAGDPNANKFETSFESTDDGVSGTVFTPPTGWTWAGDPLTLGTYASDAYGYTGTGNTRNTDFEDQDNYLKLDTGSDTLLHENALTADEIYFDQLVKFTGFEEPQTNLTDNARFAVWMKAVETEGEEGQPGYVAGETNLYVTCGKVGVSSTEQVALQLTGSYAVDTWYRLTVKKINNILTEGARAGFVVYIDGSQVSAVSDSAQFLIDSDTITDEAATLLSAQQLFPSIVETSTVANVGYKGIGAIDDLTYDVNGPAFCQKVNATVALIQNTVLTITNETTGVEVAYNTETGAFSVAPGDVVSFYFAAGAGYLMTPVKIANVAVESTTYDYSSQVTPQQVLVKVSWADGEESAEFATVASALTKVQDLEATEPEIEVTAKTNIVETTIPNFGTIALASGAVITITPATSTWAFSGAPAALHTDVAAGVTITADSDAEFYFDGTVAGTIFAQSITNDIGLITLTGEGKIITLTDLPAASFDGEVEVGSETIDAVVYKTYTVKGAEPVVTDPVCARIDGGELMGLHAALVAATAGQVVTLEQDVDLEGYDWAPIDNFVATFDGQDHTISNLTVTGTLTYKDGNGKDYYVSGLFGKISGNAIVRNLTIIDPTVSANTARAGALVGEAGGTTYVVSNITVCGTIQVEGFEYVGGLIGHAGYGKVYDCHVNGTSTSASLVQADAKVGGIAGMPGEGSFFITGCSVENITILAKNATDSKAGALLGRIHYGTHMDTCSANNVIVKGDVATVGAFAGRFESNAAHATYIINSTASNITYQNADGTAKANETPYGDLVNQNAVIATGVVGNLEAGRNSKFSAGTFTVYGSGLTVSTYGLQYRVATDSKLVGDANPYTIVAKVHADAVTLNTNAATIDIDATTQLVATVVSDYDTTVTWTSSSDAIATVDLTGLVTGVAAGEVTITATATDGGVYATCTITVNGSAPSKYDPQTPVAIPAGKTAAEYAEEINADSNAKAALLNIPAAATGNESAYLAMFEAQVVEGNVEFVLNEAAQTQANNDVKVDDVYDPEATTATITTTPGLWYQIVGCSTVDGSYVNETAPVQATGSSTELTKPIISGNAAFFKVRIFAVDPTAK